MSRLAKPCPQCQAPAGSPCRAMDGRILVRCVHRSRAGSQRRMAGQSAATSPEATKGDSSRHAGAQ